MGNKKSLPAMTGIAAISSKRSQRSVSPYVDTTANDEQAKKWALTERDISFLSSQTGKFQYLSICTPVRCDPFRRRAEHAALVATITLLD